MGAKRQPMTESAVHAAERYVESLVDAEGPISPGELAAMQESIEAIRRGEMTLEEFEQKHGFQA